MGWEVTEGHERPRDAIGWHGVALGGIGWHGVAWGGMGWVAALTRVPPPVAV